MMPPHKNAARVRNTRTQSQKHVDGSKNRTSKEPTRSIVLCTSNTKSQAANLQPQPYNYDNCDAAIVTIVTRKQVVEMMNSKLDIGQVCSSCSIIARASTHHQ
jgi:hypothetical protein